MNRPEAVRLRTPLDVSDLLPLRIGDLVLLSGRLYAARDAAHRRMWETGQGGGDLPFDPAGQVVYYVGPTPARPGKPIGSAGPTTASRMDAYTPWLLERGLRGMIGKGRRSPEVRAAIVRHRAVYFGAVEGTAALIAACVRSAEVIAYPDLDAEAVRILEVADFPVTVVNDAHGGDLYEAGQSRFRRGGCPGSDA